MSRINIYKSKKETKYGDNKKGPFVYWSRKKRAIYIRFAKK